MVFGKMKWHVKMNEKMPAIRLEKKTRNIFLPLGVPLGALSLQNAAFGRQTKSKGTLKK